MPSQSAPANIFRPVRRSYTYNTRLIRRTLTYSIQDVAELFGLHPNAIRRWLKSGLPVIERTRPFLFYGGDLIAFLDARQKGRKRPCGSGEMYCCRCREARRAALNSVTMEQQNLRMNLIRGTCELCGARMHRAAAVATTAKLLRSFCGTAGAISLMSTPGPAVLCEFTDGAAS